MKVTLKDIAKATGYTVNTVSHALKDCQDISVDTKEYIARVANAMGYIRNASASALRTGLTQNIGVITANVANPFFSIVIKEIESCAFSFNYNIIVFNTYARSDLEKKKIQQAISKSVDGIIISPADYDSESLLYLRQLGMPFVVVGRSAHDEDINYVTVDDEKGGYLATRHLLMHDKRRILYLSGLLSIPSAPYRLAGYRRALQEAGVPEEPSLIRYLDLSFGSCRNALLELQHRRTQFDGIFAFNDMMAAEAFSTLYELGLRVPQDIGLVGFDNIQKDISISIPTDSVGSIDGSLGETCVRTLIDCIGQTQASPRQTTLDVSVVKRGSV